MEIVSEVEETAFVLFNDWLMLLEWDIQLERIVLHYKSQLNIQQHVLKEWLHSFSILSQNGRPRGSDFQEIGNKDRRFWFCRNNLQLEFLRITEGM